jgi:hypothetical protein
MSETYLIKKLENDISQLQYKIRNFEKEKKDRPDEFVKHSCYYQVVGWIEAMRKPRKGFPPPDDILAYTKRVWGKRDCKDPRVRDTFDRVCCRFHQEHGNVSGDGLFVNERGDIFAESTYCGMLSPEERKMWWGPAFKEC